MKVAKLPLIPLFLVIAPIGACQEDSPGIAECDTDDEGAAESSTGDAPCEDVTPPEPPASCANPDFEELPEGIIPEIFSCEGQAGGAIVYDQSQLEFAGEIYGGPGAIQTDPPTTPFPGTDAEVGGCCHGIPSPEEQEQTCQNDCGRAACNRILDSLRDAASSADPSNGACDDLLTEDTRQACRDNVLLSLNSWIPEIEANYDNCTSAAHANSDPSLPYSDPAVPFSAAKKVVLTDPPL